MTVKKSFLLIFVLIFSVVSYIGAGFYNNIHAVISEQVYRSAQLSGKRLLKLIERRKIKTIINLRGNRSNEYWYKTEKKIAVSRNINHIDFEFNAHELPSYTDLNAFVQLLPKVEKPLLVHCWRGAERAGMASALILAIEKDLPLNVIKEQFSSRYGVLFFKPSVGGLFFGEYERWLAASQTTHSRDQLLSFIKNHYIDSDMNIKYYIDSAAGIIFDRDKKARIKSAPAVISIIGWAYHAKEFSLVKNLSLKIGEKITAKIEYKYERPDVIKFLGIESKSKELKKIGWEVVVPKDSISPGCHYLFFEFTPDGAAPVSIDTGYELCLE